MTERMELFEAKPEDVIAAIVNTPPMFGLSQEEIAELFKVAKPTKEDK